MAKKFLNFTGLTTLLTQLKSVFATTSEVAEVDSDTVTYVLNVDYESLLAFDTTEIIVSEDIILEENESLLLTASDETLVDVNDEYIIIEGSE